MTSPSHITQAQAARRMGTSHTNVGRLISQKRLDPIFVDDTIMVPTDQVEQVKAEMLARRAARAKKSDPQT